ncbi:uncharacterized protein PgNI_02060 [Pyricularia grisea]|uniref:Alpha/beta hydrolase fold-3 domain-containing protein n=1 Tax=Pyricularia grisea TaxID=148305 RepID=A0A6P8BGD5_PYRGI|nr:uncharacterized protein PgNI_02060 [Pyricularia grisea]TLD15770.1 hypothetical protein PgNI_02060 [Pyricularia grisea]
MEQMTAKAQGAADTDGLQQKRATMAAWEQAGVARLPPISKSITETWVDIALASGFISKTLVMSPSQPSLPGPLIVLFHGGGFAVGSPAMATRPGREFAEKFGATVVAPTYKLLPENAWPAGPESAWEILAWLADNAHGGGDERFAADLDRGSVVGGFSAGASISTIAAGVSLDVGLLRHGQKKLAKPITGVFANCPMLLRDEDMVPAEYLKLWTSRADNRDAPGLNTEGVELIWRIMSPDFSSPWTSPFNSLDCLNAKVGLKYYIQVGNHDPLRDDGIVFEKALAARGVETRIDLFPDDGHQAWVAMPFDSVSKDPSLEEMTMEGMRWLLGLGK